VAGPYRVDSLGSSTSDTHSSTGLLAVVFARSLLLSELGRLREAASGRLDTRK